MSVSISGGVTGNVIMAPKHVTLNSNQNVFQQGSTNKEFNITGGNFVNSTIGGTATYNITQGDIDSNLDDKTKKALHNMASGLHKKDQSSSAIPKPISLKKDYSPEQLAIQLLEKHIGAAEIVNLIDTKGYNLESLAFASEDMLKTLSSI